MAEASHEGTAHAAGIAEAGVPAMRSSGALLVSTAIGAASAKALDRTLEDIKARYGARTTDFVAMQLEYPRTLPTP